MRKTTIAFFVLIIALALLPRAGVAQDRNLVPKQNFWTRPGYFLLRFGFISGEVVRLDGKKEDGQPGASFGAAWDFRTFGETFIGVSADIHRMHVADSGQYFFDLCLNIKQHLLAKSAKIGFRPGVSAGFGVMDYFYGVERTTYMTWKGTFEIVFYSSPNNAWFADFGVMGTAFGGNSEHEMRFGPFPYLRGGIMF